MTTVNGISCNSYVAVSRETGIAVWEFYNRQILQHINRRQYAVMTVYHYLVQFNQWFKTGYAKQEIRQ